MTVTPKEAYDRYRELIRTARIEIFFSGCGSPDYAEEVFTKLFDGWSAHRFVLLRSGSPYGRNG